MARATQTIQCPDCKQDMRVHTFNKIDVDVCPNCNGVWFDYAEARAISDSDSFDKIDRAFEGVYEQMPVAQAMQGAPRHCPRDQNELKRHEWWGDSGLVMDTCSQCGGIWLDKGELEGYVAFLKDWQANPATIDDEFKAQLEAMRQANEAELREYTESVSFLKLLGMTFSNAFRGKTE